MLLKKQLSQASKLLMMLERQLPQVGKLFEMYIKNYHNTLKKLCSISLVITTDCSVTIILIFRTTCMLDPYTLAILQDQTFDHLLGSRNKIAVTADKLLIILKS